MGAPVTTRRDLLAGAVGFAGLALGVRGAEAATPAVTATIVDLPVGQRTTRLFRWVPARTRAVALFSHGHGSWPERYGQLVAALNADGVAVLAPVHVDSVHHPDRDRFTIQQSFPERQADMAAASARAARELAGLPMVAVGHSFGTLTALCLGGALAKLGPMRDPSVKAVLGFSTPGRIPGLIGPDAYAGVTVPVMIVTGTADLVPGFVTDPADHLFPAQTVRTDSYALVVDGADHGLVAGPAFARAAEPARLFVAGYGRGDAPARARLAHWKAAGDDRWTVRRAQA